MKGESPRKVIENHRNSADVFPEGARFIHYIESHDFVNDNYEHRLEKVIGPQGVEAALAVIFSLDGIPFLYNGQEIADETRHSIWGNRFHGKTFHINWENALTPVGQKRLDFIRELIDLRHSEPVLTEGSLEWIESDTLLAFTRKLGNRILLAVFNPTPKPVEEELPADFHRITEPEFLLKRGCNFSGGNGNVRISLLAYGFLMVTTE